MYRIDRTRRESGITFTSARVADDGCAPVRFTSTAATDVVTEGGLDAGRERHPAGDQSGVLSVTQTDDGRITNGSWRMDDVVAPRLAVVGFFRR